MCVCVCIVSIGMAAADSNNAGPLAKTAERTIFSFALLCLSVAAMDFGVCGWREFSWANEPIPRVGRLRTLFTILFANHESPSHNY